MSAESPAASALVEQARAHFVQVFCEGLGGLLTRPTELLYQLLEQPAERALAQQRQDMLRDLQQHGSAWPTQIQQRVQERLQALHAPAATPADPPSSGLTSLGTGSSFELVDDDTVQRSILTSRLSLAIIDKATWEFADLRARVTQLLQLEDLLAEDVLRPQVLAHCLIRAWLGAGLSLLTWRSLEDACQRACARQAELAYRQTNKWLVDRGSLPEVDLRPLIRRAQGRTTPASTIDPPPSAPMPARTLKTGFGAALGSFLNRTLPSALMGGGLTGPASMPTAPGSNLSPSGLAAADEETRLLTRQHGASEPVNLSANKRLSDLLEQQVPGFRSAERAKQPSEALAQAMAQVQQRLEQRTPTQQVPLDGTPLGDLMTPLVRDLQAQVRALKQAAEAPHERATIELVALMFQNILTEDRIPSELRVWFARLQMPTLRVALAESEFFTSPEHPARRLIDRMGACVMGFEGVGAISKTLEAEIRRVVQVIEAFPDTGRRVFKTVLREFEKFLEGYYREQNEATRTGVSLAQQIEQREALAVQYTIELRKSLSDVPVHASVREFLFHIWADVLATKAVRHGSQSDEVRQAREVAVDLMWVASAKTGVEERVQVMRRLPALLAALRQGMYATGLDAERQAKVMKALTLALSTAFAARSPGLSAGQLAQLKQRLSAIEEMMPDGGMELDDSWVLDESSHQQEGLEIVAEGGSLPSPAHLRMATELSLGSSFVLDYRGRREMVRLTWQGMHRQLSLFANAQGKCLLFQKARLAGFLQAGLLLPAQEESLTSSAARKAIDQINAEPSRLLE
jgi:hypothetical protein